MEEQRTLYCVGNGVSLWTITLIAGGGRNKFVASHHNLNEARREAYQIAQLYLKNHPVEHSIELSTYRRETHRV